jgi:hypothetical protein
LNPHVSSSSLSAWETEKDDITIGVYKQMRYIQKKDLGYNKDNIVCIRMDAKLARKHYPFKIGSWNTQTS